MRNKSVVPPPARAKTTRPGDNHTGATPPATGESPGVTAAPWDTAPACAHPFIVQCDKYSPGADLAPAEPGAAPQKRYCCKITSQGRKERLNGNPRGERRGHEPLSPPNLCSSSSVMRTNPAAPEPSSSRCPRRGAERRRGGDMPGAGSVCPPPKEPGAVAAPSPPSRRILRGCRSRWKGWCR